MLHSKVFLPGCSLQTSSGRFSTTIKILLVKIQVFGQKNATGLRRGGVQVVVLVSDD